MSSKPRLAVVSTCYFRCSHSDVIVSRWLKPLPGDRDYGWPSPEIGEPQTEIASLYIAQFPENDIGRATAARHQIPLYSSVYDALTMGTNSLAVDGVLLIGEHGDYPFNEYFQKMYPRRELFDEIVATFRATGRSVPVFSDKHLSYDAAAAQYMVDTAWEMGFPLMAGSSVPAVGLIDPWSMPPGAELEEAIGVFFGGYEAYGYHSIDFIQSLIAERAGGEAGIEDVTAFYGDSFWEAEAAGVWSNDLMEAALEKAQSCAPGHYRDNLTGPEPPKPFGNKWPAAFSFKHRDGLRSTHIMLSGHVKDWTGAVQEKDGTVHSGCSRCSITGQESFYAHFAALNAKIEEFMLTGKPLYPVQHYLLCTLAIGAATHALAQPAQPIATPHMELRYQLEQLTAESR